MNAQARLDDVVTEIAVYLVTDLAHTALREFGLCVSDRLRDRLVDEIALATRTLG